MLNDLNQKCSKCNYYYPKIDIEKHLTVCQSAKNRVQCQICNCDYETAYLAEHESTCTGLSDQVYFITKYSRRKFSKTSIERFLIFLQNAYDNNISGRDVLKTMNAENFCINDWISFENVIFKKCQMCNTEVSSDDLLVLSCNDFHQVCFDCMYYQSLLKLESNLPLSCPVDKCKFLIPKHVIESLPYSQRIVKKLVDKYSKLFFAGFKENSDGQVTCPDKNCNNKIELSMTDRHNLKCDKCGFDFCSMCRCTSHYRSECHDMAKYLQQWVIWCKSARNLYLSSSDKVFDEKHNEELILVQFETVKNTEILKEERFRYCPKCNRIVETLPDCDKTICGRIDDIGKLEDGCGQRFSLTEAEPYVSQLVLNDKILLAEILNSLQTAKATHYPFKCENCANDIVGARFECINCECVNFCEKCEKECTMKHTTSHIFRIIFKGNKALPSAIELFLNRCTLQ